VRHFFQLTLPRCRARMAGSPAVVLRVYGRASNLTAVPGRLQVRSRLRGVSPCAHPVLSPAQPGSRSSTRHDLLPGEPNAVTSALPSTVILRHFLHWSSWTLSSGSPLRQGPRNDTGAGPPFRCPLKQCSLFRSGRTLSWTESLTPRVTESRHLHCRRLQDFFHSRRRGSKPT
jgi:hypothetical protein